MPCGRPDRATRSGADVSHADDISLRPASMDDVAAIADVFLACWRESYSSVLPRRVIDMYESHSAQALWRAALSDRPAGSVVQVAERADHSIVGVVATGRDPDLPVAGHIFSLYVQPDTQGLGVGSLLLSAALQQFRNDGLIDATLWVFAANDAARGFYERLGFLPDGATRVEPQYGEPELRLCRPVAAGPPAAA